MEEITFTKYEQRNSYPHMAVADTAIWTRYVAQFPDAFKEAAYDVAIGEGAPFDTVVNPETGAHVNRLYQRKIDVVLRDGGGVILVEVKPRATTAAIGQLKAYAKLWARDFPDHPITQLVIVTDALAPEMEFLAQDEGIQMVVV